MEAYRRAALAQRVVGGRGARARERSGPRGRRGGAGRTRARALGADLLRVRARRRQREADLAERRADAQIALATLSRALGADPSVSYRPTELPSAPPPLEGDGGVVGVAGPCRAAVPASRPRAPRGPDLVRPRRRARELARARRLGPDPGRPQRVSGGNQSGAFGVLLRWNVFDPTRGKRVAAASAEAHAAELEARAAGDQVRLEVETAWRRAQAARERYAAAAGGAEEGREALRVVQERRQQGMATLTDELETEAASLAAELEELRAASEAALADAALLRAAGAL